MSYERFGDAVTFDTTYRTNLYSMPSGLFVGVNNHFQSTIFGGVLLTSEKTRDFEWAFKTFIEVMGGKHPTTVLTGRILRMKLIESQLCKLFDNKTEHIANSLLTIGRARFK